MSKKLTPAEKLRKLSQKAEKTNKFHKDDLEYWFNKYFLPAARKVAKRGDYQISLTHLYPSIEIDNDIQYPPFSQINKFLQDKGFHYYGSDYTYMW